MRKQQTRVRGKGLRIGQGWWKRWFKFKECSQAGGVDFQHQQVSSQAGKEDVGYFQQCIQATGTVNKTLASKRLRPVRAVFRLPAKEISRRKMVDGLRLDAHNKLMIHLSEWISKFN